MAKLNALQEAALDVLKKRAHRIAYQQETSPLSTKRNLPYRLTIRCLNESERDEVRMAMKVILNGSEQHVYMVDSPKAKAEMKLPRNKKLDRQDLDSPKINTDIVLAIGEHYSISGNPVEKAVRFMAAHGVNFPGSSNWVERAR